MSPAEGECEERRCPLMTAETCRVQLATGRAHAAASAACSAGAAAAALAAVRCAVALPAIAAAAAVPGAEGAASADHTLI